MFDFNLLKAYALEAFATMAQPDANMQLLLDSAQRNADVETLRNNQASTPFHAAGGVTGNAPASHPIRQPWAGGSINRPSATPEQP